MRCILNCATEIKFRSWHASIIDATRRDGQDLDAFTNCDGTILKHKSHLEHCPKGLLNS